MLSQQPIVRRELPVTQLARTAEFRITPSEKAIYTAKTDITPAKGRASKAISSHATTSLSLLLGLLIVAANSQAQQRAPILDQVAKTFGVDSWDKVEAVRYTWNGEITGLFKAAHKWEGEPKTNKVTYEGMDKDGKPVKVSYVRTDPSTQTDAVKNQIDPSF